MKKTDNTKKTDNMKKAALLILVFAIAAVFVILRWNRSSPSLEGPALQTSQETETPPPPLTTVFPKDNNRFSISTGAKTGPLLQEGYLVPFYPALGDAQTMSIKASDSSAIISALVTIETDRKSSTYPLKLTEGDATHGLWEGSWKVSDTHDNVYNIIIYAADKTSSSSVQITLK